MIADAAFCQCASDAYQKTPTITGQGCDQSIHAVVEDVGGLRVVSIRGSKEPHDWVLDLLALPALAHATLEDFELGPVHAGVDHAARAIEEAVWKAVAGHDYAITGHSLGGGIALWLGVRFNLLRHPPKRIVTFGALRVGLAPFVLASQGLDIAQYHNGSDPVPQLPCFLKHVRPRIAIGQPSLMFVPCHFLANYLASVLAYEPATLAAA